ncbi:MAG: response regulator [Cellvibrionaceae bacterium]|nr:response regulator [Cellvibrionaceae bacterium]
MYKALISLLRKQTTIKLRIYLFSLVILFLFYFTSIFSFINYLDEAKDEKIQSIKFSVSEILAKTASHALRRGNQQELTLIVDTLIESTEIVNILILDNMGEVFLSREDRRKKSKKILKIHENITWQQVSADFDEMEIDGNAVSHREIIIGKLSVDIDRGAVADIVWNTLLDNAYTVFISLFLAMPLVYIMVSSLLRPLSEIMACVKRFEQGDYAATVPQRKYTDEYAALLNALHAAAVSITSKQHEIEQKNHILEEHAQALETQMAITLESSKSADEAHIRKELIIATISQEIKRPLKGMISGLNLMEDTIYEVLAKVDELGADQHFNQGYKVALRNEIFRATKSLGMVKYGSNEINELFHELGVLTASGEHTIKLNETAILLSRHFSKLMQEYELIARQHGLTFELDYHGDENIFIYVDWIRLAQVINVMLSNAIRFTEVGGIQVKASVTPGKGNKVNLYIEVADTGIGMSKDEKEQIFAMLSANDLRTDYLAQGIGTGLMIAKKVAQILGGTLLLKSSSATAGTCFGFDAAFNRVQDDVLQPQDHSCERRLAATPNILYVEDSRVNQIIFQKYCRDYGSNLIIADSVEVGFKKFEKIRFDAVVIDCNMPVGDSFAMVADIRALEALAATERAFIVAFTASDTEVTKNKCLSYGFDEVIHKPYTDKTYQYILEKIKRR